MVEFWLLTKVGLVINAVVNSGYLLAGGYLAKTGYRYVKDYKESMSKEREVR